MSGHFVLKRICIEIEGISGTAKVVFIKKLIQNTVWYQLWIAVFSRDYYIPVNIYTIAKLPAMRCFVAFVVEGLT